MFLLVGVYQRVYTPSLLNLIFKKKKNQFKDLAVHFFFFLAKTSSSKLLINVITECEQK